MLTQQELKDMLSYDPESGEFTWTNCKQQRNNGKVIKSKRAKGYLGVKINQKAYYLHRLVWLYMYGEPPAGFIDHINRCRTDNRLCNLRVVSASENQYNKGSSYNASSKFVGVHKHALANRWIAQINKDNKTRYIGCFKTEEEAYSAYLAEKSKLHTYT